MFMRWIVIFAAVLGGGLARGQTTQSARPAQNSWPEVVQKFSAALAAGDAAGKSLLSDKPTIRLFTREDQEDISRLLHRTIGQTLLGAHAYLYPPLVMAADLAADFKNADEIPDPMKTHMIPRDETDMKRANATAAQWLGSILQAGDGQPVAVLLFWCAVQGLPGSLADKEAEEQKYQPLFILLKGRESPGGGFAIQTIIYGNPVFLAE